MRLALVSQRIFNTKHFRIVQRSSKSTHPICFLSQYSSSSSHITVHHHQGQKLSFVEVEQDIATLQHRIREAYTAGKYQDALDVSVECRDLAQSHFGDSHAVYASTISNIALMYKSLGKMEEAVESYQHALEVYEKSVGKQHASYATTLFNLGAVYRTVAQSAKGMERLQAHQQAIDCFEETYKIRRANLDSNHPDIALTECNLGLLYWYLKQQKKGVEMLQNAKVRLEQVYGVKHVSTALAMNNLAFVYKESERYDEAIALYQEVVATRRELLGSRHPESILAQHNLAEAFRAAGNEIKALEVQNEILSLYEEASNADG
ncbi:unnamed protein product [Albugo candida]|uniref:MalT-like TPR region domain-containing protein n=1 Tax=Albugo candida TaxID=65357 RepID=A0A024G448_9STRA|nr:unnamed protein product [Albugo candida]|eukprot:CCI41089.1 unnamed protein product [Albugo candida]